MEYVAEPLDSDQQMLQAMLPGGFGKKKTVTITFKIACIIFLIIISFQGKDAHLKELLNQTKRGAVKSEPAEAHTSDVGPPKPAPAGNFLARKRHGPMLGLSSLE